MANKTVGATKIIVADSYPATASGDALDVAGQFLHGFFSKDGGVANSSANRAGLFGQVFVVDVFDDSANHQDRDSR